jgi:hypothetical protein
MLSRLKALMQPLHESEWMVVVEVFAFIAFLQIVMIVLDMKATPAILILPLILVLRPA